MWILLAVASAVGLGFYDVMKKLSVRENNVLLVLLLNTLFGTLLMSPVIIQGLTHGYLGLGGTPHGHLLIVLKSVIVLSSWILGYYAIKHLPLTIQGPINASRPVMVLVGAMLVFGERLNFIQWIGILLGFASLFFISRLGSREGISLKHDRWLWLAIGSTALGAVSALYDKFLMIHHFVPTEVQAWYSLYQLVIMSVIVFVLRSVSAASRQPRFKWRWSILFISLFLTAADLCYFYSLSFDDSMISIVSMIRRGSVLVSFAFGVIVLHEGNVKAKLVDLGILLLSLVLLIIGS